MTLHRRCHAFFRSLCETNELKYSLEPLAVGATVTSVDLWYRQREEWLGTTDTEVKDRLGLGLSKATDLAGGFLAWRAARLPVTKPVST